MKFKIFSHVVRFALAVAPVMFGMTVGAQATVEVSAASADFPNLTHYRDANAMVLRSGTPIRVVFLGDSITEYWGSRQGKWFTHPGWLNRGIGGQTTAQFLLRVHDDVLALHPRAIVIEGGANDMRLGFTPLEIRDRIEAVGELAALHHVKVYLVTMTPVCDCVRPLTGLRTVERIGELNRLLASLSSRHGWTLINDNAPLAARDGTMRAELTVDGVHLNDAGYAIIQPLFEAALKRYQ